VDFDADVVPHHLALTSRVPDSQSSSPWEVADPAPGRARLRLAGLAEPFVATIRLPRGRTATRELSAANPHYLPLTWIDGHLVNAVVTNEDGGFYLHRGFSTGAVREAIVENLRAGAYRRGAGTITMQLARNLFLGHDRSLSRKAQEVVLAWILEHLTGVEKRRLLEIYLNIVEWGPGIHGADEAARFYFGHGAGTVTVDEALFLAVLLPSPLRWRGRLEKDGSLRPWTRAQMHFIGRAMIAKGWLDPAGLPAADSLRVRIAGPALAILAPAPPPADTLATQALEGRETRDEAPAD
jgi:membrane peptidoglycan carboxypeptidase